MKHPKITITISDGIPESTVQVGWRFEHEGDEYGAAMSVDRALPGEQEREQMRMMSSADREQFRASLDAMLASETQAIVAERVRIVYRHAIATWDAIHNTSRQRQPGEPPACTIEH